LWRRAKRRYDVTRLLGGPYNLTVAVKLTVDVSVFAVGIRWVGGAVAAAEGGGGLTTRSKGEISAVDLVELEKQVPIFGEENVRNEI